jgi:uncharacterized protein (TIGR00266 family)
VEDSRLPTTTTKPELTPIDPATSIVPIDFQTSAKIEGEESQIVTVHLEPGQVLRAESGAMLYMTEGVEMDTHLSGASSAFSRMLTGQNVFLTDFKFNPSAAANKNRPVGTIALGTDFPSKILRLDLNDYGGSLICQRGAFLASNPDVQIEMAFTKSFTSGFFGGQGFILQRLSGDGDVLVKAGGTGVRKELREGETLRVTSGSIVAFTSSVDYDVQMMPGIKNVMFGGEGLFVTTLKGPGTVWLQGLPSDRMIAEIVRRIPAGMGFGIPIPLGGGGSGAEAGAGDAAATGTEGAVAGAAAGEGAEATSGETATTNGDTDGDGANVDADSPSALFGDAFPADATERSSASSSTSNTTSAEPFQESPSSWGDDTNATSGSSSSNEPSLTDTDFEQSESFSTDDGFSDDDLFEGDGTTTDAFGSEDAQQSAGGILQSLWDFFTSER